MLTGINHIGIVVRELDPWIDFLSKAFGMHESRRLNLPEIGQLSCMMALGDQEVFELMMPLNSEGVVGRYLDRFGEGIHHLSFKTNDIMSEGARLTDLGVKVFGEGEADGQQMAFLHPKTCLGILYELAEEKTLSETRKEN